MSPIVIGLPSAPRRKPASIASVTSSSVRPPSVSSSGAIPHLGVHDAIGRQVLGALGRDPLDRIARLHDRDRVPESLEIELERLPVGAAREPCRQLVGIGRRQVAIADLGRELDHAARPKPAVEMVVEQHLGCAARELEAQVSGVIHEFENTRSFRSRGY